MKPSVSPSQSSNHHNIAHPTLHPERIRSAQRSFSSANHITPTTSSLTPNSLTNLLTPPLPGPRSTSPPPRKKQNRAKRSRGESASTEGYFNVRTSGKDREHDDGYERRKGGSSTCTEADTECEERTPGAELKYSEKISTAGDIGAVVIQPSLQRQHRTWSPLATQNEERADSVSVSPAVHALRSLTQPIKPDLESGQRLRRMSSALVHGLHFLTARAATAEVSPPRPQRTNYEGKRVKSIGGGTLKNGNRKGPRVARESKSKKKAKSVRGEGGSEEGVGGWATPASITLRRATEAWTLPGSSKDGESKGAELVAFHSERVVPEDKGVEESEILVVQDAHEGNACRSATTFRFSIGKRQSISVAAPSTLTFADVHVASGTFEAEGAKRRKVSIAPTAMTTTTGVGTGARVDSMSTRRISTVHFRSRDSVTEVIWREDETTSGSSPASRSPEDEGDGAPLLPLEDRVEQQLEPYQAGLMLKWSWGRYGGGTASSTPEGAAMDEPPIIKRLLSAENPEYSWSTRRSSEPLHSVGGNAKRGRGSSEEVVREVESFPPLRDRSSTMEWRRAPLVDVYLPASDSVGGAGDRADGSGTDHRDRGKGKGRDGDGGKGKGRVGSCVGFSSHVRVRGHGYGGR